MSWNLQRPLILALLRAREVTLKLLVGAAQRNAVVRDVPAVADPLRGVLGPESVIDARFVDDIPREASGKCLYTWCRVPKVAAPC